MHMCMDTCTHIHVRIYPSLHTHTCARSVCTCWFDWLYVPPQVFKFLVCVLSGLVPAELWGSPENRTCFFNHILQVWCTHTLWGVYSLMNGINLSVGVSISTIKLTDRYLIFIMSPKCNMTIVIGAPAVLDGHWASLPRPLPSITATVCGDRLYVMGSGGETYYTSISNFKEASTQPSHLQPTWLPLPRAPVDGSTLSTMCGAVVAWHAQRNSLAHDIT